MITYSIKEHVHDSGHWSATLSLAFGITAIALSVLNWDGSAFKRCADKSKNGDYSRSPTDEKFADDDDEWDDDDGNCEMKDLLKGDDENKTKNAIRRIMMMI